MASGIAAPPPSPLYGLESANGCKFYGFITAPKVRILIEVKACLAAAVVMFVFAVTVSQYRLWHNNKILTQLRQAVNHPMSQLLGNCILLVVTMPFRRDLYLVWAVLLVVAYESIYTVAGYSLYDADSLRLMNEGILLVNDLAIGVIIGFYSRNSNFWYPLWVLWGLTMLKLFNRIISFRAADHAYGANNTNLVADYMKHEHEPSSVEEASPDPARMRGYKYLVRGEAKVAVETVVPEYTSKLRLSEDVVTVERVWACPGSLLAPDGDHDGRLKDACLSFALFKLLKRRLCGLPSAESNQPKTWEVVFQGLLADGKERTFRVINVELAFLRDLLYTKFPITFCDGFPAFDTVIFVAKLGVSAWIAKTAFHGYHDPNDTDPASHAAGGKRVDLVLTFIFVSMALAVEIGGFLMFLLSDWCVVMLVCRYVQSLPVRDLRLLDHVLWVVCRGRLSKPLSSTLGQYSLLKSYNACSLNQLGLNVFYEVTCGFSGTKAGRVVKTNKPIKLPEEVEEAVLAALKESQGELSNGTLSLQRHGLSSEMSWACRPENAHTIVIWHIATSFCEIKPTAQMRVSDDINPHYLVATTLSKYCIYLLLFLPDLLPVSSFSVRYMFENIVAETWGFFEGVRSQNDMYRKMIEAGEEGKTIVEMGAKLGRQLGRLEDDVLRWKVLAGFWSELLLFLAPSGSAMTHAQRLAEGGEFITQLWALLYHAGIEKQGSAPPLDRESQA